ncbi:YkgJ family cysteine cluster protein [Neobacillus sp. CF12]|uniref:YkgJ family cysteine cluster protein n=1 Tax=Neobacillus sp. CF12 TaxID=3055864 RepID=UPI0025A3013A|nr:YkgJ family cysteine cluster protein [Neobacillus sp. CF12]MDM5329851.1 YkgJ family cysteine cluster protein [Neobacillus sp. CF12]
MKTDYRSYEQKASDIAQASAKMAYKLGTSLIEQVKASEQPDDNLVRMYSEQLSVLENYFNLLHEKTNTKPSCKSGCSRCCKYPIWTTEVESLYIANWIRKNMDKDALNRLHKNFDKCNEDIGDWAETYEYGDKTKHDEYTRKNVKCPFLINNSCSIYDARPFVCRTYFSYGNPKNCEREMYPKGTINLSDVSKNLYEAPLETK